MSKTYRIKEYNGAHGLYWGIQRKSIFGFWYNPDNIDSYTTGIFLTKEEALEALDKKFHKTKSKVIAERNQQNNETKKNMFYVEWYNSSERLTMDYDKWLEAKLKTLTEKNNKNISTISIANDNTEYWKKKYNDLLVKAREMYKIDKNLMSADYLFTVYEKLFTKDEVVV